jgi:polar amino acid transport system substrate-binding protein
MRRALLSAILCIAFQIPANGWAQSASNAEIAPAGKLRVGMIAIQVLGGVAEPVGKFFADRLGASFQPVMYPNPEAYAQSFGKEEWDIAIGPRVLASPEKSESTADLWAIDLIYVAAPGHQFADAAHVDRGGVKIGTIQGSPSDRFLSRTVKSAELVRIPLSAHIANDAADLLRSGRADVFGADAGVGFPAADALAGATIVPGTFNVVRVATAFPRGRSSAAQAKLAQLLDQAKRTGVVQGAIDAQKLRGVRVARE